MVPWWLGQKPPKDRRDRWGSRSSGTWPSWWGRGPQSGSREGQEQLLRRRCSRHCGGSSVTELLGGLSPWRFWLLSGAAGAGVLCGQVVAKESAPRLTGRVERSVQQKHRLRTSTPVPLGERLFEEDGHLPAESHRSPLLPGHWCLCRRPSLTSSVYFPVTQHLKPSKIFPPEDLMYSGEL